MARPSLFTDELFATILDRIADGESLRAVCRSDGMPAMSTVLRWVAAKPDLRTAYAATIEVRTDMLFDEILEIADDGSNDWMEKRDRERNVLGWVENGEAVRRSALRVDARKWMLARMAPKKYGDKLLLGGDAAEPLTVIIRRFGDAKA